MTPDIALPEPIDPDEPVIRFIQIEYRTCGDKSPVARDPLTDDTSNEADDWHSTHFDITGHGRSYRWRLERGTSRMYRL